MIQKDEDAGSGVRCASIVFSKNMATEIENQGANCWMKNASKAS
jgi:hypothetical protein